MRTFILLAIAALLTGGGAVRTARAEDPPKAPAQSPPLADRAKILRTEMRRGPAADLAPYLAPDADPTLRKQAIRALGRIGDRAGAPELLVKLLGGGADAVDVLHAAGLNGSASLEGPVVGHLTAKEPAEQAAALEALGWITSESLGGYGAPLGTSSIAVRVAAVAASRLHSPDADVRAAALGALGLAAQEGYLERVLRYARPSEPEPIHEAAAFASWFLARARKTAAKKQDPQWPGDDDLGLWLVPRLNGVSAQRRLDAVRPLGLLMGGAVPGPVASRLLQDPDARVVQEAIVRVLATRKGDEVDAALVRSMEHGDPKVRQAAAEALGEHGTPQAIAGLKARAVIEVDDRVRGALAAALTRAGHADISGLADALPPITDPQGKVMRATRISTATRDPEGLTSIARLAMRYSDMPLVLLVILEALKEHKDAAVTALVEKCLTNPDPYVRAAAIGLVGKQELVGHLEALDGMLQTARSHAERDIRQAVIEAWAAFAKAGKPDEEGAKALRARISEASRSDPAFTARAAARKACKDLGIEGCPAEDPLQPNDWQGLPRPKVPLLGLDLTKGGPWLDEAEILQLADRMAEEKPEFVIQNRIDDTEAAFRLAIDPSEAPVHAVSFVLAATSGVHDGTSWHRVVPSFVIQGGDPHGDGSGDAGWSVPDEITRARFVRGALGMPKGEIRDTGGCQLFVMHSDYRPLDGRYTNYGRVTAGMETVDKIRVGDRITGVRMVMVSREPAPR